MNIPLVINFTNNPAEKFSFNALLRALVKPLKDIYRAGFVSSAVILERYEFKDGQFVKIEPVRVSGEDRVALEISMPITK